MSGRKIGSGYSRTNPDYMDNVLIRIDPFDTTIEEYPELVMKYTIMNRHSLENYRKWFHQLAGMCGVLKDMHVAVFIAKLIDCHAVMNIIETAHKNFSTCKTKVQTILWLLKRDEFSRSIPLTSQEYYEHKFQLLKQLCSASLCCEREDHCYSFEEIKEAIYSKFNPFSNERLMIDLYECVPARDDFGSLRVFREGTDTEHVGNHILVSVPEDPKDLKDDSKWSAKVVLAEYKTNSSYGTKSYTLPPHLIPKILRATRVFGNYLFQTQDCEPYQDHKLSRLIHRALQAAGIHGKGSVNLIRRSLINSHLRVLNDQSLSRDEKIQQIANFSEACLHSPATQVMYQRMILQHQQS